MNQPLAHISSLCSWFVPKLLTMLKKILSLLLVATALGAHAQNWTSCNAPEGGIIKCIDTFGGYLWSGTLEGGIYRSANNGGTWQAMNTGLPQNYRGGVGCILSIPGKLFAGTTADGLYMSTNLGALWTKVNLPSSQGQIVSIIKHGSYLFCNSYGSMMRSSDNGVTWTFANTGLPTIYTFSIVPVLSSNGVLLTECLVGGNGVFYRSTDNGNNWSVAPAPLTLTQYQCVNMFKQVGSRIFAIRGGMGTPIHYTDDAGLTWNTINSNTTPYNMTDITISNGRYIIATTTGVMSYPVGGSGGNWYYTTGNIAWPLPIVECLHKNSTGLYAGTYGSGLLKGDTSFSSFAFANSGLIAGGITFIDGKANRVMAKVTKQRKVWSSTNAGNTWTNDSIVDYYFDEVTASAKTGNKWYITVMNVGAELSQDGGQSWKLVNTGLTSTSTKSAFATASGMVLVGGANTLFKCVNDTAWTPLYSFPTGEEIYSMAEHGSYLFVGTQRFITTPSLSGHLYRSADGGQTWQVVSSNWNVYVDDVYGLAVQGNRIIAGTQGYGTKVSSNDGNTWDTLNTGFFSPLAGYIMFNDLKVFNNTVYAVTKIDERLFQLKQDSTQWTCINSATNDPRATKVHATDSILYMGTANNGVWKKSLIPVTSNAVHEVAGRGELKFALYPNPSSSITINAGTDVSLPAMLQVVDAMGRLCTVEQVNSFPYKLSAPQLSVGTYQLIIEDKAGKAGVMKWSKSN